MPKIQNVTLVRPSMVTNPAIFVGTQGSPSLALAYMAASLREAGYKIDAIDAQGEGLGRYTPITGSPFFLHGLTLEQLLDRIPEDSQFIGITCMFTTEWFYHKGVINAICARFPGVPIVIGGEHATASADYVLRSCPGVTAVALGEGDETIVDLLNALSEGKPLEDVAGLMLRGTDGSGVKTESRSRVRHLDEIPWPAWDLLPIERYLNAGMGHGVSGRRNMPMMASRGCPYRCTFCSNPQMWGKLWNVRSAKDVVAEMKYYKEKYEVTSFSFYDLTAIIRKDWILEFTDLLIQEKMDIRWLLPSGTRSEALDRQVMRNLKLSGCLSMNFAPESGSPRMLELIRKQVNLDKMLGSIHAGAKEGIFTNANIIMGMPGETRWDMLQTVWFIIRAAWAGLHDVGVFPFTPYPGSVLNAQLQAEGKFPPEGDEYDRVMSLNLNNSYSTVRSWNDNISDRGLSWALILTALTFYVSQFTFRPWRGISSIRRLISSQPITLMERVVFNMICRVLDMGRVKKIDSAYEETAPVA